MKNYIGISLFLKPDWSSGSIFLINQNILKKYKSQMKSNLTNLILRSRSEKNISIRRIQDQCKREPGYNYQWWWYMKRVEIKLENSHLNFAVQLSFMRETTLRFALSFFFYFLVEGSLFHYIFFLLLAKFLIFLFLVNLD